MIQNAPKVLGALLILLAAAIAVLAGEPRQEPLYAVVRIPTHGISGTVIEATDVRSLILTCAHGFQGESRSKPIQVDVLDVSPGPLKKVGVRLIACDYQLDLSLIEVGCRLPYSCPVAPAGHRPSNWLLSAGHDEMKEQATVKAATIVAQDRDVTFTREIPWHGRSGGPLLDERNGYVIGTVIGYEAQQGGRGMYTSHSAILTFLARQKGAALGPDRRPAPISLPGVREEREYRSPVRPYGGLDDLCPDGRCPLRPAPGRR